MRFLITRPKPDADHLAKRLEQLGHTSWLSPVMKLDWRKVKPPAPNEIAGLVITSRNAIRSLEKWHDLAPYTSLPLFAVGKTSAIAARRRGFKTVYEAAGRAETLVPLIKTHLKTKTNLPLYHPSGKQKAFDLVSALQDVGVELIEQCVYETIRINRLAPAVIKGLNASTIDGVLLLSPRTASLFADLVRANKLEHCLLDIACLCLSQNVASKIDSLNWRKKLIASHPKLDNLLDLIEQIS